MIYITGDTHGEHDWSKLNTERFPEQEFMTLNDYVIICGDFGGIWAGGKRDKFILDWYAQKKFTILFIDGNHENFDLLNQYPVEEWNGGFIHRIRPNVIHLMRGQVFTIDGKKFFTFGGGLSIDKEWRIEGMSWWPQEIPNYKEIYGAFESINNTNNEVDYVITHTAPTRICALLNCDKIKDPVCVMLDEFEKKLKFKHWHFGHFHYDIRNVGEKFTATYNELYKLEEK